MGYFSDYAIDRIYSRKDHSYTPPEIQLMERLEELEQWLESVES